MRNEHCYGCKLPIAVSMSEDLRLWANRAPCAGRSKQELAPLSQPPAIIDDFVEAAKRSNLIDGTRLDHVVSETIASLDGGVALASRQCWGESVVPLLEKVVQPTFCVTLK